MEWGGDIGDRVFWNKEEGDKDMDKVKDEVEVGKSRQAKLACMPSSWQVSLFKKASPGMKPRFLNQKIDANESEKKMPLMAANASRCSTNIDPQSKIHKRAQLTFFLTQGIISTASKTLSLCWVLNIGVDEKGVCLQTDVLHHDLEL